MSAADYRLLQWDSDFFGVQVATITNPHLETEQLAALLAELRARGVEFVYWHALAEHQGASDGLKGQLLDAKTTYAVDLTQLDPQGFVSTRAVEAYAPSMPYPELEALAIQSGYLSRYRLDTRLPPERADELYQIWIRRSVDREIAREVLVIREGESIVGMVTLGEKEGRGEIGLIAVAEGSRGKRYGEALVRAAQEWFLANGFTSAQVVTQGANTAACRLYEKCGYAVEKVEHVYHFWL